MALQMGARSTILVNMILWSVRRKKSLMDAVLPELLESIQVPKPRNFPSADG